MDISGLGDDDLALALQAGDGRAFDVLVRRHQGRVYGIAYRMTGRREDALDVSQDVFLKIFHRIDAWQPRAGGFLPWMLRMTTNQSIDALRRRKRRACDPLDEVENKAVPLEPSVAGDPAQSARAEEIEARIQRALQELSGAQRAVFVMRHYEGLALADIAGVLGCSTGSVKVHLFRALRRLQKELGDLYAE